MDEVGSYFGMRSISLGKGDDGKTRMLLNGTFVPQVGTLDQGYWPDGVYTAPTDEALKFDLVEHKKLGFNMVRKHMKVEPDRWFYWADRLGLLVWQDMPAMFGGHNPPAADKQQFETEMQDMVRQHDAHPSVVMWVPFNEGWGEYEPKRVADTVKGWDPSRSSTPTAASTAATRCRTTARATSMTTTPTWGPALRRSRAATGPPSPASTAASASRSTATSSTPRAASPTRWRPTRRR